MIRALVEYTFLQHAVLSALLASLACGIIGTIIVEKKLIMMSGGVAHTSFSGIGMGYFLKIEPIIGALFFALASALGIVSIKRKININTDSIIGMFWSAGMAIGILFIAFTPGYPPDMSTYLFGDILIVSNTDLIIMCAMDTIIFFVVTTYFKQFKVYLFDEEFASVTGINTVFLEYLLFILIALTIVVLIRVVGIILIIALLTAPVAIAKQFTYNLKNIMFFSSILGAFFCITGLWISYEFQIASGSAIVLLAVLTYILVTVIKGNIKLCKIKKQR